MLSLSLFVRLVNVRFAISNSAARYPLKNVRNPIAAMPKGSFIGTTNLAQSSQQNVWPESPSLMEGSFVLLPMHTLHFESANKAWNSPYGIHRMV